MIIIIVIHILKAKVCLKGIGIPTVGEKIIFLMVYIFRIKSLSV